MSFNFNDLQYLSVPLPQNILKFKLHGDLDRAANAIRIQLERDLPTALRRRLEMELEILKRLPRDYCCSFEEALARCQKYLSDFTREELISLQDHNDVEWIFRDGDVYFKNNFFNNLISCYPEYKARVTDPSLLEDPKINELLLSTIDQMKKDGKSSYHFRLRAGITLCEDKLREGEKIKIHLPLPLEYAQVKNFKLLSASEAEEVTVSGPDAMQRTICFADTAQKGKSYFVEYEFDNCMVYHNPDPEKIDSAQPSFYTNEQLPHIRFTPYIKALTREIIGNETNQLKKARLIYDYVTSHIMYSFMPNYFEILDIAEYAATGWKGDCGVQALLFITLCRCAGIPARWQSGLYVHPMDVGCHDWAQYYIAPYGWLYADCSFGSSAYRAGAKERRAFYSANLEPFRMPANREFQQPFDPEKTQMRSDPYDNQLGEAEYADRAMEPDEYDCHYELLESHPLN